MCGIIGYVGPRDVVTVLVDGLKRLEYRGYDSAGIAVVAHRRLMIRRCAGKIRDLERRIREDPLNGTYGVGHTRWATHGRPSEENAHPHRDCRGEAVVVHNGIIENYLELKRTLSDRGHRFVTETDTEVIAHLIEEHYHGDLVLAVRATARSLRGSYAFVALHVDSPEILVGARNGPPLVVAVGDGEYFLASDIPAVLEYTRDFVFLDNEEIAVIQPGGIHIFDFHGNPVEKTVQRIQWDPVMAQKGGYRHFMLKEIHEQPRAIRDTLLGRFSLDRACIELPELAPIRADLQRIRRVYLVACGSSYHACLTGKYMIESLARVPVEVDYASEFRYRDPLIEPDGLAVLVSQSGETADTLAALRLLQEHPVRTVGICNVVGSMLTREVDAVIYTHAGPEIGVASTKTFTTQLIALYLLALYLAQERDTVSRTRMQDHLQALQNVASAVERTLEMDPVYREIARALAGAQNFLYLARGIHYPIALEGALKLKEISYIHAEGYPAGEMKHGPIALIDRNMPVVAITPSDHTFEKMISNMQEVRARDGRIVAITHEHAEFPEGLIDFRVPVPHISPHLDPVVMTVPLQLIAYHIAVWRGCDVDQPRNLAKSVTVE